MMQNYNLFFFVVLLLSGFVYLGPISNHVMAVPSQLIDDKFVFGPIAGLSENESGAVDWIMVGNWRSNMVNDTNVQNNQSSNVFNAAIEMIKPDGTARHTHTLTDFVVLNVIQSDTDNSTIFNGTSTISLGEGLATDIPTAIQRSYDGNVFVIMIDPESDYNFGNLSLIYGINADSEFVKMPHFTR